MSEDTKIILRDGALLFCCLLAICGFLYLPWHEPLFAGILLLVSMALSWGFKQMDIDPDIEP